MYDAKDVDNITFFCPNCGNVRWTTLNEKGTGKMKCPDCNCDVGVKRERRKYVFSLFDPRPVKLKI